MRIARVALAAIILATVGLAAPSRAVVDNRNGSGPALRWTPPGQISVVTVNAKQSRVLDVGRFKRLYELVRALRQRPRAFDGGFHPAVAAPDAIVLQEMRASNAEIFQRLLRQNFSQRYTIVGDPTSAAKIVINEDTVEMQGEAVVWSDACTDENNPSDGWTKRDYQFVRLLEKQTSLPFVVAGVEFASGYGADTKRCVLDNVRALRSALETETTPVVIGGDFNRRAVQKQYECDANETSPPTEWWSMLTDPSTGRAYQDAAKGWHRRLRLSLETQWTHEQVRRSNRCDGSTGIRRTRIDYLFSAGADVAVARADHPGWTGGPPGTRNRTKPRYSDHRFVSGRFAIGGPPQPQRPQAAPVTGAAVTLSWDAAAADLTIPPVSWKVYRSVGMRGYRALATLGVESTSYRDASSRHGTTYRYAIVPVAATGAHGVESRPARVTADGRGPQVKRLSPAPGAAGVDRRATIVVRFDERINKRALSTRPIRLYAKGRRVAGAVTVRSRSLVFDPARRLRNDRRYTVVVPPVSDKIGNFRGRLTWRFRT